MTWNRGKIRWNSLQEYLYFSSGKSKFLLNFNTHSEKRFTQQRALHGIICAARRNEHLPRLILIWPRAAETRRPGDPHLELTCLSGAISFPYLGEKWHLLQILKHATSGGDLDSSLENNSRLCGCLRPAGQQTLCCQWQGAIRWQIPQTGSFPVGLNKSQPGVGPSHGSLGLVPIFSLASQASALPWASKSQGGLFFVSREVPLGREPPLLGGRFVIGSLWRTLGPTFWESISQLYPASVFPSVKNMPDFKPQINQTFVNVFKILPWEIRE